MTVVENDTSKAKSAAFALAAGWESSMNSTSDKMMSCMSEMRKTAIDTIFQTRYADDSVYDSLEKSYINNFIDTTPDFDEIKLTLKALAAINTDKSINLLFIFLQGLHQKKIFGVWSDKEAKIFPWIIYCFGVIRCRARNVRNLLVAIYNSNKYSTQERLYVRETLKKLIKQ